MPCNYSIITQLVGLTQMKKVLLIIGLMLMVLASSLAYADLTVTDFTLGDKSTQRENPLADDDEDQDGDVESASFTVTNDGPDVTGATIDFGALQSEFNLTFTTPTSWVTGDTKVTVKGVIPKDWDSQTTDENDENAINAGTFTVGGDGVSDATGTMEAQAEAGLSIDNIKVIIDGKEYDYDDDEVEEIIPGSSVKIKFDVKNEFNKDSEIEIEDIDITVDSDNSDIEVDNEDDEMDLKEDDEDSFTTDIDFDWDDVDDGDDATIDIEIDGTDDNGARHTISLDFKIEVQYPEADVEINGLSLSPRSVCVGDDVVVRFDVENTGTDDQKNLFATVQQTGLDWDDTSLKFNIDGRDDSDTEEESKTFSLSVPNNVNAKDYEVKAIVYYDDEDGDQTLKFETATLEVSKCDGSSSNTGSNSGSNSDDSDDDSDSDGFVVANDPTTTTTTATDNTANTATGSVTAVSKPKNDNLPLVGLIILAVLLVAIIVSLIVVLTRR